MEYYIPPSDHQRSEEIRLPDQLGKQLFSAHGDLVIALQNAVQPFHFNIAPSASGVEITGDETGVLIASRVISQIAEAEKDKNKSETLPFDEVISSVIINTLRRDLVFRLNGVSYPLTPMSLSQVAFVQMLLSSQAQLMIGVGSTGTGKTHTAIAVALNQLAQDRVKRIVITKPHVLMDGEVVTAATRQELDYDSQFEFFEDIFRDLIGYQRFTQLKEERKLELIPLGHLRSRTFNDAFIILDEAQNMTVRKMRMAVTRMGRSSRMVVTGDPVHVDLRDGETSGLVHLLSLLEGTDLAKVFHFEKSQVIRNSLVAELEKLYAEQQENVSPSLHDAV